ncbi:MAG: hypothetical protein COA52_10940 [Hyphomicrobiales bacterium]|nr:MAG: hypothetical protein COA52_10940 [Hyphomicrobiales bacterium]
MNTEAHYDMSHDESFLSRHEYYDGVLSRRVIAYVLDIIILSIVATIAAVGVAIFGLFTFGLGWMMFLVLMPLVTAGYLAFTLGGRDAATPGMRFAGLQMRLYDGRRIGAIGAIAHGLLFYLSITILTPFIVLVGLFTQKGRLLHDLILGTYVVRAEYL